MKKILKWLGFRHHPTREELESKYDASITLWSDTKEAIMTHPIAGRMVVAENLESAEAMLQCDYHCYLSHGEDSTTVKTSNPKD